MRREGGREREGGNEREREKERERERENLFVVSISPYQISVSPQISFLLTKIPSNYLPYP